MHRLFALMMAIALMIVPLGMVSGGGAAHAGQQRATTAAGACHEDDDSETQKGVGMSAECALACAALPEGPARIGSQVVASAPSHPIDMLAGVILQGPESSDPPPRA